MGRTRRLVGGLLATLACATYALAARAPARLSDDHGPANIDSSYGSGNFGTWRVDDFGLPAFDYDADELTDARARQPELAGGTQAQHQVGNDHVVAAAFNHGYTQLWSQDRLSQWANRWDPDARHWAGGFGWLAVDGTAASTLWLDRAADATFDRTFGVGYVAKQTTANGVDVREVTYAPFGDDPVLLDDVTITNHAGAAKAVSWVEYWDVNPYDQPAATYRGVDVPAWDPATSTLSVAQSSGGVVDATPLSIFAAAVQGPVDGFDTSIATFFGSGTRAAPDAVVAGTLAGTLAAASPAGAAGGTLFAFRAAVTLAPGESTTLRYVYGMAHPDQIGALVAKYRAASDSLATSEAAWADWLPKADFGDDWRWVARELEWDAYLLRSASVFEEVCGHHTITQGGYYQYQSGLNLGTRSWPHYMLPIAYAAPELAREILRYTIGLQPEVDGRLAYGTGPLCTLVELGTSGDLDFWLLLAAAEYGLTTRDLHFFDEPLPFYDTRALASVWEHVKRAYRHQETYRAEHGGYVSGTNGDWSDFSSSFLNMSESTLIGFQLAYAYPRLADLAERLGDDAFAAEVRARGDELRTTLRGEWTGKGWYSRGYGPAGQIGTGAIWGEPQPWAILAGLPTRPRARQLVGNIRRFLGGVDAPDVVHGPTRIGSSLTPAANDPDVTEKAPGHVGVGDNNANYVGGVWFDVNGWLAWALGELDGVVPRARALAWDEYVRNTLATHATAFPDHWAGTVSIDDTCYAYYSSNPAQCGNDLYRQYDGQITEQPTWMVMNAIHLAGISPTKAGYRIAPRLPVGQFSLRLPQIGVAASKRRLRGYVRVEQDDALELRVRLPKGAGRVVTFANGHVVRHKAARGYAVFTVPAVAGGTAADWAVTW